MALCRFVLHWAICSYTFTRIVSAFYCRLTARSQARQACVYEVLPQSVHVGYAQNGLQNGATLVTPQFLGINTTGGAIDLQSIKCNDGSSDSVLIMTLDSIGLTVDTYAWIDWYENPDTDEVESCWVDGDFNKVDDISFAPGQALWVQGDSEDQMLTSAGKVGTSDVAVQLRSGATLAGNAFPVSLNLQDIRCSDGCSDSVLIMTLDEIGLTVDTYAWIDWYENTDTGKVESCWVDGDFNKVDGVNFEAGQGLWIQGDSEDQVVVFPGVEL